MDELDSCFFFQGSGPDGYFGVICDKANKDVCMSDEAILAFIQDARPDLVHKLRGLPMKPSDVPSRQLPSTIKPDGPQGANADAVALASSTTPLRLAELQHKHEIQFMLLDGYYFLLRRVSDSSQIIKCACSKCSASNPSPGLGLGQYFLTLVPKPMMSSIKASSGYFSYSLICLESLFSNHPVPRSVEAIMPEYHCDGNSDLLARNRSPLDSKARGSLGSASKTSRKSPDLPFRYPSNSARAWQLRQEREIEIDQVEKADEKFEHVHSELEDDSTAFPSLSLRRPPNHTGFEDRYKKEGLTRTRPPRRSKGTRMDRPSDSGSPSQDADREPSTTERVLAREIICSCREPEDGDGHDVVKCAGEHCMIGLYHLHCVGFEQPPADEADWFCPQCVHYADRQRLEAQSEADDLSNDECDTSSAIPDQGSNNFSGESSSLPLHGHGFRAINSSQNDGSGQRRLSRPQEPLAARCHQSDNVVATDQDHPSFVPLHGRPHTALTSSSTYPFPRTPFYALAPFIAPSHHQEDSHVLTLDEARRFWGWRAHCSAFAVKTDLLEALPLETRDLIAREDASAMTSLGQWWRRKMMPVESDYHLMALSKVLATSSTS